MIENQKNICREPPPPRYCCLFFLYRVNRLNAIQKEIFYKKKFESQFPYYNCLVKKNFLIF